MSFDLFNKPHCDRCCGPLRVRTMSKFNKDVICMDCKAEERQAPGYVAADDAEVAAIRGGDFNFPGVGLSPQDREFLAEQRATRGQVIPAR